MLFRPVVFHLSLLALSVQSAYASELPQSANESIERIEVTATRYAKEPHKSPGAISVIQQEELAQQFSISDDVSDLLGKLVPGMTPSRQKLSNQGENLRGRTALILVDGVPQNNPLRNGNRYGYPLDGTRIERVEVIAGASALYGMGATGGIINYVTQSAQPGDHWKQTIGTRLSSSFKHDGHGSKLFYKVSQYDEKYQVLFSTAWQDQGLFYDGEGRAVGMNSIQGEIQDSTSQDFFLKAGYHMTDTQFVDFSASRYQLKSKENYVGVPGNYKTGVPGSVRVGNPDGEAIENQVTAYSIGYRHEDFAGGEIQLKLFQQAFHAIYGQASWWPMADKKTDQGQIESQKHGFQMSYHAQELMSIDAEWVIGLDGLKDKTAQTLLQTGMNVTPWMSYQSIAPFIQGDFRLFDDLQFSAGLRFESILVDVQDSQTLYSYGNAGQHQVSVIGGKQRFLQAVYNLGLIYEWTDRLSTFAAYNQGFGLPDIGRTLRGKWVGHKNPEAIKDIPIDFHSMPAVAPVVTDNYEVGVHYLTDKWQFSASTYLSIAKDGANLQLNEGGTYDVTRQRTDIRGVEANFRYTWVEGTSFHALFSHMNGEVDTNQNGQTDADIDLRNMSPDRLYAAFEHQLSDALQGQVQYNYLFDKSKSSSNAGKAQSFDGYGLLDINAHLSLNQHGRLSFGIQNVLNRQYINYFSQVRQHNHYYFSGRGRTFSLSYAIDF
ncbi:TonB-dependent receptor [Algicola sagamiensis]|uniref:TonB-dependent receptor n=1 Tax=Algicola sagamiensis TaxID=163869 RepID=UPI00038238D6|nr:TonB-dependent receptor [Algicola sagamiensis]